MRRRVLEAGCVLLAVSLLYGCRLDAYDLGGGSHWDRPDGTVVDGGDACVTTSATEICDGLDNNCDGVIDEGFDLSGDTRNCGECGELCEYLHAEALCVQGECQPGSCLPGYWDLNNDPSDDCEYNCHVTNNGVEACDNYDNDCDGEVDEGIVLDSDELNCGSCGYLCADHVGANQDVASCSGGVCQFTCQTGWNDLDGDLSLGELGSGCEFSCHDIGVDV